VTERVRGHIFRVSSPSDCHRSHVGADGGFSHDVPNGLGGHPVGLSRGPQSRGLLPATGRVRPERPDGLVGQLDFGVARRAVGRVVLLDVCRERENAVVEVDVVGNVERDGLRDAEPGVVERRDQRVVASGEVRRARFDGRGTHPVDLLRLQPDGRFVLSLGFHCSGCLEVVGL